MRSLLALAAGMLAALVVPSLAAAEKGVYVDPGTPAGKEYALPLDNARNDASGERAGDRKDGGGGGGASNGGGGGAADGGSGGGGGSSDSPSSSAGNQGSGSAAPLFGAGVSPAAGGDGSSGSRVSRRGDRRGDRKSARALDDGGSRPTGGPIATSGDIASASDPGGFASATIGLLAVGIPLAGALFGGALLLSRRRRLNLQ